MPLISAVIITHNEEKKIGQCLDGLKDVADEIVVVDSFSTDQTAAICALHNVKFFQRNWDDYSSAKNYGNSKATNDWVLSIDADEALSDELKKSVIGVKNKNAIGNYKFNRLTNYCGKWIRHCGWYPDTKTRLFNRNECSWQGVIHEILIISSSRSAIFLKGDLLHYSYDSIEGHIEQQKRYAEIAAQNMNKQGRSSNLLHVYLKPLFKFLRDYIFLLGFLDGKYGFIISKISAKATYKKYARLRELNRSH